MTTKPKLEESILNALAWPMAYPEIEKIVGRQKGYELGIALGRMALNKQIHYAEPRSFASEWPVYSRNAIPMVFKHPTRAELTNNPNRRT